MEKSCLGEIASIILVLIFSLQVQGRADHTLVDGCSNYTFHVATKINWKESRRLCKKVGGDLVSIQGKEKWIVLKNTIQNLAANEYLIGLKKDKHSGRWAWLSNNSSMNTSRGKSPWAPAQPSGDGECAEMFKDYNKYYGVFNDLPCTKTRGGYICERHVRCTDNKALDSACCPCSSNPCRNGGFCHDNGDSTYSCSCQSGFTGANCKKPLDPCSSNPCQNGGRCDDKGDGTYGCSCQSGFTGNNCQKFDCSAHPCRNGGTCVDLAESAICKCSSEFTGRFCQGKTPDITQHPKDAVRMEGGKVTFCCEAKGEPAPTFSWFHNEVPMKNQVSKTLRLTSLSIVADGLYKCRATNEYGKEVSSEAKLTVIPGDRADSCDPTPISKIVSLPRGCTEVSTRNSTVDVGTCSYDECIKRGQGDSGRCGGEKDKTRRCCSPMSQPVNSPVSCINGMKFNVEKVRGCRCSLCAVPDIVVRGRVVDEDGNASLMGEITVNGGKRKHFTDLSGYFRLTVKSGTKRLVLNIKDPYGNLQKTTKAFDLHPGQVSFYNIVLQKKPPAIKFAATQRKKIPINAPSKPNFVAVDIPEKAFVTADGDVYEGETTANVGLFDPRTEADMEAAPGDFSAIDDNGEEVMLGTAGMLRQSFTDSSGKELNLDRNITFRIDADKLDVPDGVTVYQYYLNKKTGRWVKFGALRTEVEEVEEGVGRTKRQTRRKFFVSDITPDVPYDTINWDYESTASFVRVLAPVGAVVSRIGLSDNGQSYTSYRQETVPSNGILCMRSLRDKTAVMQADLDGAPLKPQEPKNFPAIVNPKIISGQKIKNHPFQSFQFFSSTAGSKGPVYALSQQSRCHQRDPGDFAFVFQQAGQTKKFASQSLREGDPREARTWKVGSELCFIKALVTGLDTVIYVKSTGKAHVEKNQLDYGYVTEKTTRLGTSNESVACLEYRCNSPSDYQTHLQVMALTGRCQIIGLNDVMKAAQGYKCKVTPDPDSIQENNFCVPADLSGGDAGLYKGFDHEVNKRCLIGDNSYTEKQSNLTNKNPTVLLTCR